MEMNGDIVGQLRIIANLIERGEMLEWGVDSRLMRKAADEIENLRGDSFVSAGDAVLLSEQASLLRECRTAIDSLIAQKPGVAGLICGSTTIGNLRASLYDYRPKGVFGS